ncbi:hypothetical protein KP509_34G045300 [Ceratopteris richardii]|nr:hypothetical protein KP509_34G045300 [Ceratopteris richardii]
MEIHDVYSWTALLSGYVNHGKAYEALNFFCCMQKESVVPTNVTFISALKACTLSLSLDWGRRIHAFIVFSELEYDVYVVSCLVDMYAKCGSIKDAAHVFSRLILRNVVSWSTMISGYVKEGQGATALGLFMQMQTEKVAPNEVTLASSISACALIPSLGKGQEIHHYSICCGFDSDNVVKNKLIDMYMKCGYVDEAQNVFDGSDKHELTAWNTMIEGYAQHGHGREAVQLFQQMIKKGVKPDKSTFLSCLKGCIQLQEKETGECIFTYIQNSDVKMDAVLGSSIINMFARCGSLENAHRVFKLLHERDVIAWTIIITAFFDHGDAEEAFRLFDQMRQARVLPDKFTYNRMINACVSLSDFRRGKKLHADIIANKLQVDTTVGSSLVDMYANFGDLEKAQEVFDSLQEKDIIAWNAMVAGYVQHGDSKHLYSLFNQMHQAGITLDKVACMSILSAYNHWGLVDEGYQLVGLLTLDPGSRMISEHCSCFIDLLGRAGHLNDVGQLIGKMPFQPSPADWMSLLGACKLFGNTGIAKTTSEKLQELQPYSAASYVLYSNTVDVDD